MSTGFTTDGISMNTMCAVSLANHLRAVADAFCPLKVVSATFLLPCFVWLKESTFEKGKNIYFTSKAISFLR